MQIADLLQLVNTADPPLTVQQISGRTDKTVGENPERTAGNRVALSNMRERLARYGGSLSISDREGGGSVVTLHIRA